MAELVEFPSGDRSKPKEKQEAASSPGDFSVPYMDLEPVIRDVHRQAKTPMLAFAHPDKEDEDGDDLGQFATERLAKMVGDLNKLYYDLHSSATDPKAMS
jgi:hypothetical protein